MRTPIVLCVFLFTAVVMPAVVAEGPVVETEFARWELNETGRTIALLDKASGQSLIAQDTQVPF
ncbi:MAG: hypothetical protein GXY07_06445, partial [Candidatus Hydrogenedentes bacterium]|nr:hypothetical protein [Candidatus Hydrogenedentota bacterium]